MVKPPRWHFDRTGFPYLVLPGTNLAMALWPVTKTQLELWLADPQGPGDDWYLELLRHSPRGSWRSASPAPHWTYFATGVFPQEIGRLAEWLGPGYRLPDATEWRTADRAMQELQREHFSELAKQFQERNAALALGLGQRLSRAGRTTWPQFCLLESGILEWVSRPHGEPGGLGRPMSDLPIQLILDPQAFDPVTLLRTERHAAFGARLLFTSRSGFVS